MPWSPARPCLHPGCRNFRRPPARYCEDHSRDYEEEDRRRGSASQRGYDNGWRKLREQILLRDPVCKACGRAWSTEVDHVIPKEQGGTDHEANLQGLCHNCHADKTAKERKDTVGP